MKSNVFLLAAALPLVSATSVSTVTNSITLASGQILGNARDATGILNFKGIPFSAPPVGNLRWHAPEAPTKWQEVLNTTVYGPSCYAPTIPQVPYSTPPSEDCLSLNVWTGAQQASEKRPVMVWIYGGGFQFGSSAMSPYDGSKLAAEGVVVVTFNYRLGVFGFLALSELDSEGTLSGNFGLQDQQMALDWVKNNIAAFGGDPDNVTIFGESAGAHSVGLLMSSPLSKGLFEKAILESGAWWDSEAGPLETFAQARQRGAAFEQKVGATSVAQLRALSAATIGSATAWNERTDPKQTAFAPGLDNYVLTENPGTVFQNGQQLKVPLLGGFNGNEGLIFLPYGIPHATATQFQAGAMRYFGTRTPQFLTLYPDGTPAQLNDSADALIGDQVIREQTYAAIDAQYRTAGLPANSVWIYQFNYTSPYNPIAAHTTEVPFVFGNLNPNPAVYPNGQAPPSAQDIATSKTIMAYWTNFAKTGNPNGPGLPTWPAYKGAAGGGDFLNLANTIAPLNYNLQRLQFINSFRTNGVLPESWRSISFSGSS